MSKNGPSLTSLLSCQFHTPLLPALRRHTLLFSHPFSLRPRPASQTALPVKSNPAHPGLGAQHLLSWSHNRNLRRKMLSGPHTRERHSNSLPWHKPSPPANSTKWKCRPIDRDLWVYIDRVSQEVREWDNLIHHPRNGRTNRFNHYLHLHSDQLVLNTGYVACILLGTNNANKGKK